MNLPVVRERLKSMLQDRNLTQEAFARRHDISLSWLNKFIRGHLDNPRYRSLERLEQALDGEAGGSDTEVEGSCQMEDVQEDVRS
jgi:transcriptional regulator with XRE-family HTH domain